jgi:hypothetical protein
MEKIGAMYLTGKKNMTQQLKIILKNYLPE